MAVLGFVYFYCANNNHHVEAKTKMKPSSPQLNIRFARKLPSIDNNNIIEPPPITRDWQRVVNRRSLELDYNETTKQGYKSHHNGRYNNVTNVAREGRKSKDLDPEAFKVKYTELLLKIDIAGCVHAHNQVRRKHNLSILLWDTDLSYGAEEWALVLAARGEGTSKLFHIYLQS